ncbi:MAG: zinc ribbon domain-containing protein [Chloroflexota bacterium]
MPTYDYQCQNCGQAFEAFATIKQKTEGFQPECPWCHSKEVQQAFRSVMFIRSDGGGSVMPTSMPMAGCGPLCGPGSC